MIKVSGIVKAIQKGVYEDYAVIDGVNVEIAGLNNSPTSTDPDYVKNTLQDAYENGEEISIIIKDSSTGRRVPVTATISTLNIAANGKITAVLNGVHAPLESITNITKPASAIQEEDTSGAEGNDTDDTGTTGQAGDSDGN